MLRQRRSGHEADVWRISLNGQRDARATFGELDGQIEGLFATMPDSPLTSADRARITREIDTILAAEFGADRAGAADSPFYAMLLDHMDQAGDAPALRTLDDLERLVTAYGDPAMWEDVRSELFRRAPSLQYAQMYRTVYGPTMRAARVSRARFFDPQRAWVRGSRLRLSDRVWLRRQVVRRGIDREITNAILRGVGPKTAAKNVKGYLASGHGRKAAERLMRTEIQRAHAEATRNVARQTPGVKGLKWVLSLAHPKFDECDHNAQGHSAGMRPGEYTFEEFPTMPDHPNCLCHSQQVLASREEVFAELEQMVGREGVAV